MSERASFLAFDQPASHQITALSKETKQYRIGLTVCNERRSSLDRTTREYLLISPRRRQNARRSPRLKGERCSSSISPFVQRLRPLCLELKGGPCCLAAECLSSCFSSQHQLGNQHLLGPVFQLLLWCVYILVYTGTKDWLAKLYMYRCIESVATIQQQSDVNLILSI